MVIGWCTAASALQLQEPWVLVQERVSRREQAVTDVHTHSG